MMNTKQLQIPTNAIQKAENDIWYFFYKFIEEDYSISFKKYEFDSLAKAEKNYVKIVKEYDKKINAIKNSINLSFSLKSYLQYWLYEIQYPKVANRRKVVLNYMINQVIIPSMLDNPLLTKVTTAYLDDLFSVCKRIGTTSGWMSQLIMGNVFKTAIEDQYLKNNPMSAIKLFPREKPKFQVIDYKDVSRYLYEAKYYASNSLNSNGLYLEILLALFCGLRKGEIQGLRFDDFDETNHTVTIKRQLEFSLEHCISENGDKFSKRQGVTIQPKTESSFRCIKIHPVIFTELALRRQFIEECEKKPNYNRDNDGFVCLSGNGNFKSDGTISNGTKKIAERCGLPPVSCHDLRHTCATLLLEFGVEVVEIAKVLGHVNPHTTLDIYCTTMQSEQDIADLFDSNLILHNSNERIA